MTEGSESPQQVIFREFDKAAVDGWARGEIEYRWAGKTGEASIRAFTADGSVSYPDIGGFTFDEAVEALRTSMAQPVRVRGSPRRSG